MLVLYANIFQPLIDVFEAVLKFFHNSVGLSWGWSIVAMTVAIRAAMLPLTFKQFHSMQKLQQHMPELKAIQNKYKDDKQRQQQEVMKFYKENNVNPFASCLPLAAQLPVFISLFYMLREDLRPNICPQVQEAWHAAGHTGTTACGPHNGANFLFISDITNKATGLTLIALLVLYVGTQLGSTLMMSSPTMDKNQRRLMTFMPLIFVFIIVNFPAGLIVYWITTNTWTMGQQFFIKKAIGAPPPPAVIEGGDGRGGGGGDKGRDSAANGSGGGGLGSLLRSARPPKKEEPNAGKAKAKPDKASQDKAKPDKKEKVPVASSGPRTSAPPRPPRKKKKRSGRRR